MKRGEGKMFRLHQRGTDQKYAAIRWHERAIREGLRTGASPSELNRHLQALRTLRRDLGDDNGSSSGTSTGLIAAVAAAFLLSATSLFFFYRGDAALTCPTGVCPPTLLSYDTMYLLPSLTIVTLSFLVMITGTALMFLWAERTGQVPRGEGLGPPPPAELRLWSSYDDETPLPSGLSPRP